MSVYKKAIILFLVSLLAGVSISLALHKFRFRKAKPLLKRNVYLPLPPKAESGELKWVKQTKEALSQAEVTISKLKRNLRQLEIERDSLREELKLVKNKFAMIAKDNQALEDKTDKLTNALADLQNKLYASGGNNRALEIKIRDTEAQKASLENMVNSLQQNSNQQDSLIKSLQDKVAKLDSDNVDKENKLNSQELELHTLRLVNSNQANKLARQQLMINDLNAAVTSMNERVMQLSEDLTRKIAEANRLREENLQAQISLNALNQRIAEGSEQMKIAETKLTPTEIQKKYDLEEKLTQLNLRNKELESLCSTLKGQIASLNSLLKQKEAELIQMNKDNIGLKEEVSDLNALLPSPEQSVPEAVAQRRAKASALRSRVEASLEETRAKQP